MKKFVLAFAAMVWVVGAQAQQRSFTAQGVLQPLSGLLGDSAFLEVLGKGPGGDYSEYYSLEGLPGSTPAAMVNHSLALAAHALSAYTQASARFSYDLSATNSSSTPGTGRYGGTGFSLSLGGTGGTGGTGGVVDTLLATDPDIFLRDRTTLRAFSMSAGGDGYPPAPLSQGDALVITDPTPPTYSVDLQALMATAACCSSLHQSAPGSLWVLLQAPTAYRPVYMGLSLSGSRSRDEPVDGALPSTLDLARYDLDRDIYVIFGGHYGLTVDEAAYASATDYLVAKAWIEGNISLVNTEFMARYELTGLQAVPVPEPAAAGLLAVGLLMLAIRRRRHPCAV